MSNGDDYLKKHLRLLITVLAILVIAIALSFFNGLNGNEEFEVTEPTQMASNENENMHLGFGVYTYVSPIDAFGIDEGKLQDGQLLVNTAHATLIINNDSRIVYAYLDEVENSILFNEEGKIITSKDVEEWPSLKESDEAFNSEMAFIESSIIGMSQTEVENYIEGLNQEDFASIDLNSCLISINNAFSNTKGLSSVQNVGVSTVTRYTLTDASEETNGDIDVITTFALVTTGESDSITGVVFDEVETNAQIDINGKVLTSRFDTRTKVEKCIDGQIEEISSIPAYYLEDINALEEKMMGLSLEEAYNLSEDSEFLQSLKIVTDDLFYAFLKASENMIPWY